MFMGGSSGIAMPTGWTGYTAGSNIAAMISNWNGYIYSASTVFAAGEMRAPIFYDSNDPGFYLDPNSYSRLSRVGVGGAANDVSGININGDAGLTGANFFYFGHNNGSLGSWQTRTFASSGRQIWNTNGFEVNRDGYGGGWSMSINSAGSTTFNSTSDLPININGASHKYLTINPGNGYEAMVRYIGGSGSGWYVGKRTTNDSNITTADFHFYSEAAGRTVGGFTTSGAHFAHSYQGNTNVGGTGNASWHPSGAYIGSTMWQYGDMYKNNTAIFDVQNIYNSGWFRNYGQTGLYSQTYNGHIVKMENLYWSIDNGGQGTTFGLQFRHNYNSTVYGYVYGDTSGQFGLLNGGSWAVRTTSSGGQLYGNWLVSGSITATGDITAFSTSDRRHKNNIVSISDALLKVTKLNGVTWEWNEDVDAATKETPKTGLIAQEVEEILPEVVKERADGFLALDYSKMMGLMVEAIKEQQQQIEDLKKQINYLVDNK
jgi:hypothetical protein